MFYKYTIRDTVRVPPNRLQGDLKAVVKEELRKTYEGTVDEDLGVILAVTDIKEIGEGKIIWGDGGVYVDTVFDALAYIPLVQEVVDGYVTDITEFGAFVRVGPMDGLVHVSQVMDDFVRYDPSIPAFIGKETERMLKIEDNVRARIVTVAMRPSIADTKIGMTMRQPGLGKWEWIEEDKKKAAQEASE
ncbi:MAG: DNA-directed RNA polymerase [Candidatus Diapherotrites archaeon]|nr:DNA-directed RNA polymerase [Candidatus Diapherotrites archaeon]